MKARNSTFLCHRDNEMDEKLQKENVRALNDVKSTLRSIINHGFRAGIALEPEQA